MGRALPFRCAGVARLSLSKDERQRICERVREMSRHLDFNNYADPLASSLLVIDVDEHVLAG